MGTSPQFPPPPCTILCASTSIIIVLARRVPGGNRHIRRTERRLVDPMTGIAARLVDEARAVSRIGSGTRAQRVAPRRRPFRLHGRFRKRESLGIRAVTRIDDQRPSPPLHDVDDI